MPSAANRSRIRARHVLAAFAPALAALAVHAAPAHAVTNNQCSDAWKTSPAAPTCTEQVVSSLGETCKVSALCEDSGGKKQDTVIEGVELGEFPQLRNCNGVLTVSASSC